MVMDSTSSASPGLAVMFSGIAVFARLWRCGTTKRPTSAAEIVACTCVNHKAPSGPTVRPCVAACDPNGTLNSVATPSVEIRPSPSAFVNHSAPSGPAVIDAALMLLLSAPDIGTSNSMMTPLVVIRPMIKSVVVLCPGEGRFNSVNHNAPSGPAVIFQGSPNPESGYSVIVPSVVIRPIALFEVSVNHSAPSGPAVMPPGEPPKPARRTAGTVNSSRPPSVAIRPTSPGLPPTPPNSGTVNHSAPSGPTVILRTPAGAENSVMSPLVVIRPI